MQSPNRSAPDLVFGICFCKQPSSLEASLDVLKSDHGWFELQAGKEAETRFWIDDGECPSILLVEVAIDRPVDLTQIYLSYWRSFGCPIIWIIHDDISYQSLSHPIYNQLTRNLSLAGECILNHSAVSERSVTAIAKNLLSRSHSQSNKTTSSDVSFDYTHVEFI